MCCSNRDDLTGRRYGRLLVLRFDGRNGSGNAIWRVRCDCGVEFSVRGTNLKSGNTRSCGCLRSETMRDRNLGIME